MPAELNVATMAPFSKPDLKGCSEKSQTRISVAYAIRYKWYRREELPWFSRGKPYLTYLWEFLEAIPTLGAIQNLSGPGQPQAPWSKQAQLSVRNWTRQSPHFPSYLNSTLILYSQ